ncbi:MAG TPA: hypothetical protein VFO62_05260 [Candidatus Binatia bacterium]|nr:hypothetical protein [Candidatus Binatia bacterium]
MAKARKTQDWLPGIDILRDALARTSEVATSLTTEGIDSVFRVLGVVSERDLAEIRHALARLEKRLTRIEAKRRGGRVAAAAADAAEAVEKHRAHSAS